MEELSPSQALGLVVWEQRVPGNCHTRASEPVDLRQIGQRQSVGLQALTYRAVRLETGRRYVHEYVIVPMRPGACLFPPPVIRAKGAPLRVEVEPEGQRVLVSGPN